MSWDFIHIKLKKKVSNRLSFPKGLIQIKKNVHLKTQWNKIKSDNFFRLYSCN